jgi:DNA repair protein RecO (recombination protein O)
VAAVTTRAIVLRAHDYRDSSRILRFYTEAFGLLSVVAHGVRGRTGKGSGSASSFATGELTAYVRPQRDLHTMKDFTALTTRDALARDTLRFAGASVATELVLAHAEQERHDGLFEALERALDRIESAAADDLPAVVLGGLWTLIDALGFAPQVHSCVRCGNELGPDEMGRFDVVSGGVRCAACADVANGPRMGPIARRQLSALLDGETPPLTHARQHFSLVGDFIAQHVVPKPLKSMPFLTGLLPADASVQP